MDIFIEILKFFWDCFLELWPVWGTIAFLIVSCYSLHGICRILDYFYYKKHNANTGPLVWNHRRGDASRMLGNASLKSDSEGVYVCCALNNTEQGNNLKELVERGDIESSFIFDK